jgi:trk system potassium uptake protein TrkH
LSDVEIVPRSILFWRGFTQWLGGVGLVVIFVALLSELGPGARMLIQLEVPGPEDRDPARPRPADRERAVPDLSRAHRRADVR